jgi:hypothetical protein
MILSPSDILILLLIGSAAVFSYCALWLIRYVNPRS